MKTQRMMTVAMAGLMAIGLTTSLRAQALDAQQAQALAEEAYIYGLPLIMSYKTMYAYSVESKNPNFKAPFNQIKNTARVYGPKDTAVVSANSDTPYSLLWMDLRAEPVILTVPKIDPKRYYSVMLQDLGTYLIPYIGSRTTGNNGGSYLMAGPDWKGEKPEGIDQVMNSQTDFLFAVYRTQLFNAADLENVTKVQAGYKVQTLSEFLGTKAPAAAPTPNFPAWDEEGATGNNFIAYLNFLLRYVTPDATEKALWEKLAPLGVAPGKAFDFDKLSADQQQGIAAGIKSAKDKIKTRVSAITVLAGQTAADYNHDWLKRAAITQMGWGANDPKEASYPQFQRDGDGNPLDTSKANYTLTFAKGQQPPVKAFWSLTMYDGKSQLMVENPINRYLLNSTMLSDMKLGKDGSLTLYIQKESPGKDLEGNWLPAPDGPFYMLMRLYWPKDAFLDGAWKSPTVEKASE